LLDCRDYKTGRPRVARVADDPAARLQAWLFARVAAERGLRLQLRYEHLVPGIDEDPVPFDPGAEDIAIIESEIGAVAAARAGSLADSLAAQDRDLATEGKAGQLLANRTSLRVT